jgi:hypothetical protein
LTLSELINEMIQRQLESSEFTSANPTHINTFIQTNAIESPDIEDEIKRIISENSQPQKQTGTTRLDADSTKKEKTELKTFKNKLTAFDKGNVGEIQSLTSAQFGNVRQLASNPVQFMMGTVFKKMAKGAGVVGLALILMEVVKFIINELLKPGRLLDRRFKRDIEKEIFAFRSREEKQKLRQGFSNIIITSIGGLRGGQYQTTASLGMVKNGTISQVIPVSFTQPGTTDIAAGASIKERVGRPGPRGS